MSDQATEAIELPHDGDAAFASLMDALAPEQAGTPAAPEPGQGAAAAGAADGGAGASPAAGAGEAPAAAGGTPVADAPVVPGAQPAEAGATADTGDGSGGDPTPAGGGPADLPADWTASAADVIPQFGDLTTALEKKVSEAHQAAALEEVAGEFKAYFEALEVHPRSLVGREVPRPDGKGSETLSSSADAKDWQDAVRHQLASEVRSRASKAMDEQGEFLSTIHASIDLFRNNADLVPGTKEFDVELANRFTTLAEPYELQVDGKLQGYSVPVQPLVNQLRAQIVAERAAAATAAAAGAPAPSTSGAPATPAAAPAAAPVPDEPQAGIASKAGGSAAGAEDYSTLWATIGLPPLSL